MRVRFAAWALLEIAEIGEYIAKDNPKAAERVMIEIRRRANSLSKSPFRGRKQRGRKIWKIGTLRYPYNIFYRVDEVAGEVLVLNVRHAARRRSRRYQNA